MVGRLIIAAAGSGKTEWLVKDSLKQPERRSLITTYTNRNTAEIKDRIERIALSQPGHLDVMNWCSFIFKDGVSPYQFYLGLNFKIEQVSQDGAPSTREWRPARSQIFAYYLDGRRRVFNDRLSDLACQVNEKSDERMIARLKRVYDHVYIDEAQDLAGWDFDFVKLMLLNDIAVTLVGDPRQRTYSTNNSKKHATKGVAPIDKLREFLSKPPLIQVEEHTTSHRSNQIICDFADSLYPERAKTISAQKAVTGHDGVFLIREDEVNLYACCFDPYALRWDKDTPTYGIRAMNFGESKGATANRVVIFPTKSILEYLARKKALADVTRAKFYVALTRARYSSGIVVPTDFPEIVGAPRWNSCQKS
jgi:DNA helicase-2/ATP-dependent DNA helicase PcrA